MCLVEGSVEAGEVSVGGRRVRTTRLPDGPVTVGVRPESLALATDGVAATARFVEVLGADTLVLCRLPSGEELLIRQPFGAPRPGPDEPVHIAFGQAGGDTHLFDRETGMRHPESTTDV